MTTYISSFFLLSILFITMNLEAQELLTPYEQSNGIETATYQEAIDFYTLLAKESDWVETSEIGTTDYGEPLHLVVIDSDMDFDRVRAGQKDKVVVLINNGIHPGEPEGIDATMILARNLAFNKSYRSLLHHAVVCIIPIYNVGGALNRGSYSRANQNGPVSYGFRGNAKNLDLNRDFIKMDSKNMFAFADIFQTWQPHIFIDNHTSNGADYQHTMTLIASQVSKVAKPYRAYWENNMQPALYQYMKRKGFPMVPYIYSKGKTPEAEGIIDFMDSPRYSSGYTNLFQTLSFVPETHMLKPFDQRMESTYELMKGFLRIVKDDYLAIIEAKKQSEQMVQEAEHWVLDWKMDTSKYEMIDFMGYESGMKESEVTGQDRLFYDRKKTMNQQIRYYNAYLGKAETSVPKAYIIPQQWTDVIDRLKHNRVEMTPLVSDKSLYVESYYIKEFDTAPFPFEGHYVHRNTQVEIVEQRLDFRAGDWLVPTDQLRKRFVLETLEPQATDSYFNWNFFDAILQQKEHFSAYVFEDIAAELLKTDEVLRRAFEQKKSNDTEFAKDARAQLDFIYRRSPYYERTHRLYPIVRLFDMNQLGVGY